MRLTAGFQVHAVLYGNEPQGEDAGEADHGAAQQREHPWPVDEEPVEIVPRPRSVEPVVDVVEDVDHVRAVTVDARVRHRRRHVCCRAFRRVSCQNRRCLNRETTVDTRSPLSVAPRCVPGEGRLSSAGDDAPCQPEETGQSVRSLPWITSLSARDNEGKLSRVVETHTYLVEDDVITTTCSETRSRLHAGGEKEVSLARHRPFVVGARPVRVFALVWYGEKVMLRILRIAMPSVERQRPPSDRLAYTED